MVKETIQAVRKAEAEAAKSEKDATVEADEMICRAQNDVKNQLKALEEQYRQKRREVLGQTQLECEELMERTRKDTLAQIDAMYCLADQKREDAISAVISELI